MEKKKRILPRLFAALVILTLVSCCFIGSTFARYTSSSTGSATVEVAKWDIDVKGGGADGSTAVTFNKLSPAKEAYVGEGYVEENVRTKSTAKVKVAEIKNLSDVAASVTVTATGPAFKNDVGDVTDFEDYDLTGVFTIALYYGTTDGEDNATNLITSGSAIATNLAATNGVYYIYAVVTWTSDDNSVYGAAADARDTWIGENITSVAWNLTYTAVQASELPA